MIVTVTLNPALDVTYVVEGGVRPGAAHRVRSVAQRAGGKGVNTARVLTILGEPVLALGLAGGAPGAELRQELDAAGVPHRFTPIAGTTRRTVAVVDAAADGVTTGGVTGFWEPGPEVTAAEWARFLTDFGAALLAAQAVVLSGSLPPGIPRDAYAQLVRLAAASGVLTLVDADADALSEALAAHPTLVKPNAEEALRALPTIPSDDTASPAVLAQRLVAAGAEAAVVSAGADGLVAWWGGRMLAASPPRFVIGNATGAGDAASAALAVSLAQGLTPGNAVRQAVAWSAAAVAAPLAGDLDADLLAELEPLVAVRDVT